MKLFDNSEFSEKSPLVPETQRTRTDVERLLQKCYPTKSNVRISKLYDKLEEDHGGEVLSLDTPLRDIVKKSKDAGKISDARWARQVYLQRERLKPARRTLSWALVLLTYVEIPGWCLPLRNSSDWFLFKSQVRPARLSVIFTHRLQSTAI